MLIIVCKYVFSTDFPKRISLINAYILLSNFFTVFFPRIYYDSMHHFFSLSHLLILLAIYTYSCSLQNYMYFDYSILCNTPKKVTIKNTECFSTDVSCIGLYFIRCCFCEFI